jgi:hypothetical protein
MSSSEATTPTLAQRLANIKKEQEEVENLSLYPNPTDTINFGRKHCGKTFQDVWNHDPNYVEWFVSHCSSNLSPNMRRFARYVEIQIEAEEFRLKTVKQEIAPAAAKVKTPNLAEAVAAPVPEDADIGEPEDFDFEYVEPVPTTPAKPSRVVPKPKPHPGPSRADLIEAQALHTSERLDTLEYYLGEIMAKLNVSHHA